ncbi:MAG: nitroreductase family protein [Methanobacteriota archaeon]|nr:MAG: nitroreductase family protein [Euryarchaeota archaeon]
MEVVDAIEGRRSVRAFKPDQVDDETITEGLRLANLAPSAGNLQARDFIVVRGQSTKNQLMDAAYGQDYVETAPVVVVFCANLGRIADYGDRGRELYCLQDVAAAVENMMLYLHSRGLGSVWVGAFDEKKASEALGLPDTLRPVAILPIGHPAEGGGEKRRMPLEKITHRERWQ